MRLPVIAVAALAFLRIVLGLHFFLEGLGHLRDPNWSSAGFRRAAQGPLADWYRAALPQTGDWSATLGAADGRSVDEAGRAWRDSVVGGWQRLLAARLEKVPLAAEARAAAEARLAEADRELEAYLAANADGLATYRLEIGRQAARRSRPEARDVPFERDRLARKAAELGAEAAGWMADAEAIGARLVGAWDGALAGDDQRRRAAEAAEPTALWKADRFVSWSLVTIGACLIVGILVKFNAVGGAIFLASVLVTQPFWVTGAQATYNQWTEFAALLAIAAMPSGGWNGLEYFLKSWCPLAACCRPSAPAPR
jgi:uncharacterized membrane protein YphA (DoxX/SURF4 family)